MRAQTVAVVTLAALSTLDLTPKAGNSAQPQPATPAPGVNSLTAARPIALAAATVVPPELTATVLPIAPADFADIQGHWAAPAIRALAATGVVQGFPDRTFRPDAIMTPADMAHLWGNVTTKYGLTVLADLTTHALLTDRLPYLPVLASAINQAELMPIPTLPPAAPAATALTGLTRAQVAVMVTQALTRSGKIAPLINSERSPAAQAPSVLPKGGTVQPLLVASTRGAMPEMMPVERTSSVIDPTPQVIPGTPPAGAAAAIAQSPSLPTVPSPPPDATPNPTVNAPPPPDTLAEPTIPDRPAVQPTPVESQLATMTAGKNTQELRDYWTGLCQGNAPNAAAALAACDQLITINPRDATTWAARGDLLLSGKKYTEAAASYNRALAIQPSLSGVETTQCQALSELGNQDTAIAACDRAIQINQNWGTQTPSRAWYNRGVALKRLGRNEAAIASYDQALFKAPNYSLAWADECRVLSELGKQEQAIAVCDRALAVNGDWGDRTPALAWYNRALAATRSTQYEAAVAAYDQYLALNPKDGRVWTQQGLLLGKLGKHKAALAALDQALKVTPNDALALVNRCATLNKLGQYADALAACEQAMSADGRWDDPNPAYVWSQHGSALAGLGRLDEALASADRAIAIKSDYADAWSNRGVTLWRLKRYQEALDSTDRAIALSPNDAQAWFNKGRMLRTLGRDEAAVTAYDRALQGDINPADAPTLADIWANRSAALWHLGNYPEALRSADRAVTIKADYAQGWYNRGVALIALKQPGDAILSYQRATTINPHDIYAWMGQGVALHQIGKDQEALKALDKALQLDPTQPLAQSSRDRILQALTKSTSATKSKNG